MPDLGVLLPTGLVGTGSFPFTITIEGMGEVAHSLIHFPSFVIEETATDEANGTCSFMFWDEDSTRSVTHEALVRVYDDTQDTETRYVIRAFHYEGQAVGRWVVIDQAVHVGILLDEMLVPLEIRPSGEGTKARFGYFWGKYAKFPLVQDLTYVDNVDASLPQDVFQNATLRSAARQIAEQSGSAVRFYVDQLGRPHLFSGTESTPGAAPFNINVALTPGGGNIAPDSLEVRREGPIKNRVYIRGANAAGSGWYQDDASVATYGPREDYVDAPSADTAAKAQAIALLQLGRTAEPNVRGTFRTAHPNHGWRAGQNITITSTQDGLSSYSTRIVRLRTTFLTGEATPKRAYEAEFANTGARLSGVPQFRGGVVGGVVGQVVAGTIVDASGNSLLSTLVDANISATEPGFGAALRRFITSGVYNGDFAITTPVLSSPVSTANPLPYWKVGGTGTSITAHVVSDTLSASGYVVRFEALAGDANDETYLEQIIPINGSRGLSYVYDPVAAILDTSSTSTALSFFTRVQYLKADGVTVAGSEQEKSTTFDAIVADRDLENWLDAPGHAYWLRLRVGVKRTLTNTDTGAVDLAEVRMIVGDAPTLFAPGNATEPLAIKGGQIQAYPTGSYGNTIGAAATFDGPNGRLTLQTSPAVVADAYTELIGRLVGRPASTAAITAAGSTIPRDALVQPIDNTSGGPLTLTSAPTILDGQANGQLLLVVNVGSQNVTIQDQGTLASSNLRLSATTVTLGPRDSILLMYSTTIADWVQVAQTNVL